MLRDGEGAGRTRPASVARALIDLAGTGQPGGCAAGLQAAPFSPAVRDVIVEAVKKVTAIESQRGQIARTARSALDPAAQPYQDLIDQLLFRMAGLTDAEIVGLEERYAKML